MVLQQCPSQPPSSTSHSLTSARKWLRKHNFRRQNAENPAAGEVFDLSSSWSLSLFLAKSFYVFISVSLSAADKNISQWWKSSTWWPPSKSCWLFCASSRTSAFQLANKKTGDAITCFFPHVVVHQLYSPTIQSPKSSFQQLSRHLTYASGSTLPLVRI